MADLCHRLFVRRSIDVIWLLQKLRARRQRIGGADLRVRAMMIKGLLSRRHFARKEWLRRLDRIAGDLNILLVVVAVGLATLDLTFLFTQRVIDRLPQMTRVVHEAPPPAAK